MKIDCRFDHETIFFGDHVRIIRDSDPPVEDAGRVQFHERFSVFFPDSVEKLRIDRSIFRDDIDLTFGGREDGVKPTLCLNDVLASLGREIKSERFILIERETTRKSVESIRESNIESVDIASVDYDVFRFPIAASFERIFQRDVDISKTRKAVVCEKVEKFVERFLWRVTGYFEFAEKTNDDLVVYRQIVKLRARDACRNAGEFVFSLKRGFDRSLSATCRNLS